MPAKPIKTDCEKPSITDREAEFIGLVGRMNDAQIAAFLKFMESSLAGCRSEQNKAIAEMFEASPHMTEEDRGKINRLAKELLERHSPQS